MHAGNIYASLMAWLIAKSQGGRIVLRIEDLDRERSKAEFIDLVQRDYEAFGLVWDEGPYFQGTRDDAYESAYSQLADLRVDGGPTVYPCFCTRADLKSASAPHLGEKNVYAGTCRNLTENERQERSQSRSGAMRLRVPDETVTINDAIQGSYTQNLARECGDFIIRRADGLFAYQLAVVIDDAEQGITSVVRGYDLLPSTPQQVYLQRCLGYETPKYAHIPLLVNAQGKRLAKRDKDASISAMLEEYGSVEAILGHIAFVGKLIEREEALTAQELLSTFDMRAYVTRVANEVGALEPITWR